MLDDAGWTLLRAEEKKKKNENETFAFLGKIAQAIIGAVDGYDNTLKPQAEARPSPHATSCHTKAGYRFFPDWRAVVSSSIDVDPKPSHRGGQTIGGSESGRHLRHLSNWRVQAQGD